MPNRILKDSVCTSDNLDALTAEQEVFWYRLLVQCDDYGRMDARPAILRARCYPLRLGTVSEQDVSDWLTALEDAHLIYIYEVTGKPYLQVATWDKHQQVRAKRSKYPPMISDDIRCNQLIADAPVIQSNPIRESESKGNTPPPSQTETATYGQTQARKLQTLNGQVSAELRTPLANALLDVTGKRRLADVGGAEGERLLMAAHEAAVTLYRMGLKSESDILALEPAWNEDWRGVNGGTAKQFLEFVSEQQTGKTGKRSNGNGRTDTSRGFGLASLTTDADRAYHAANTPEAIAKLQAEWDATPLP
jgi:hypothetical protein